MVGNVLLGVCGGGHVATIVSGGAKGPDAHAARFAELAPHQQALTLIEHRPDWSAADWSKGHTAARREVLMARNTCIVTDCHALLFFQTVDESGEGSRGTQNDLDKAASQRKAAFGLRISRSGLGAEVYDVFWPS